MSKFNILYWNIHYKYGTSAKTDTLNDSSKIIVTEINRLIEKKKDIGAIIFTEGYPQINIQSKECDIIKKYFENKGYYLHPYTKEDLKVNDKPFYNDRDGKYVNGILIATKDDSFSIDKAHISEPEFLLLKKKNDLYLGGLRISSNKTLEEKRKELNWVKENVCGKNSKVIIIGDFNMQPNEIDSISKDDDWNFKQGMIKCDKGTNLDNSYVDHIYIKSCNGENVFTREREMEEFYTSIGRKDIINIKPSNWGKVKAPYPDHNLLFASIDLGD